jgi:hypothetical protein
MKIARWDVPKVSIFPAILLSLIVILTFQTLRSYGPESTVRKFHVLLRKMYDENMEGERISPQDWAEMQSLFAEDIGQLNGSGVNPEARALIQLVNRSYSLGSRYSFSRMDRLPREVRLVVLYTAPGNPPLPIVWIVEKPTGTREWKISIRKTLAVMN